MRGQNENDLIGQHMQGSKLALLLSPPACLSMLQAWPYLRKSHFSCRSSEVCVIVSVLSFFKCRCGNVLTHYRELVAKGSRCAAQPLAVMGNKPRTALPRVSHYIFTVADRKEQRKLGYLPVPCLCIAMDHRYLLVLMPALLFSLNGSFPFPFLFLYVLHTAIVLSTFSLVKQPNPSILLHTCKTNIVLLWGVAANDILAPSFLRFWCLEPESSMKRCTCSWLEESASWPETVNHQQYPDGLWLGLMMMHVLGDFPGFVHDSFSFDFPGWKGKLSQNIVCIIEYFTHSFAPIEPEILRWLLHGDVMVLHHESGSVSVFLFCCVQAQAHRNLL